MFMNTQCLLTINNKEQLVDFAPFQQLMLELFQLVSVEPIPQEHYNDAFHYAVTELSNTGARERYSIYAALISLGEYIERYLLDHTIILLENNPERYTVAIKGFLWVVFNEQGLPITDTYYDLNKVLPIERIVKSKQEWSKCLILFRNILKWHYYTTTVRQDVLQNAVNDIFRSYNSKTVNLVDPFLNKKLERIIDLTIKCVVSNETVPITSYFQIKEQLKQLFDTRAADHLKKVRKFYRNLKWLPSLFQRLKKKFQKQKAGINTKCLLNIEGTHKVIDFGPFKDVLMELFELVSEEPIPQEHYNNAFQYAISNMLELELDFECSCMTVAFDMLVTDIEKHLLNNSILNGENNPERIFAIMNFFEIVIKKQQLVMNDSYYDFDKVFDIGKITTDAHEWNKCLRLFENFLKWYTWKKLLSPERYSKLFYLYFDVIDYGVVRKALNDPFEDEELNQFIYQLLKDTVSNSIPFTTPYEMKLALKHHIDQAVAASSESIERIKENINHSAASVNTVQQVTLTRTSQWNTTMKYKPKFSYPLKEQGKHR